ncbi:MAG: IclR family transcriptional regulator [Chloroflexi bacterium]|nr:IclR family transcriptional regulator [Chloroflexota bacterium]
MSRPVQSVERALGILELLGNADYHLGISEIAEISDLPLSTAHRLLSTLMQLGYVEQNPETNKYTLGVRILQLRGAAIGHLTLGVHAMPVMKSLMNRVNETVHLAILNEGEVVYIERVEGLKTQGMYTRIGKRAPAHCTALGKVMLAFTPQHVWYDDVIKRRGLKRFSATTITTEARLLDEFEHHSPAGIRRGQRRDRRDRALCRRADLRLHWRCGRRAQRVRPAGAGDDRTRPGAEQGGAVGLPRRL